MNKLKTIPASKLSTISMVAGGEKKHPRVIHEGILKNWVGFGWVNERKATNKDKQTYPTAIED
jgi:hypothetical protein